MNNPAIFSRTDREANLAFLMAHQKGQPEVPFLAQVVATWAAGGGVLPDGLGLDPAGYGGMMEEYFGLSGAPFEAVSGKIFDPNRMPEIEELRTLLSRHRKGEHPRELWIIEVIIAGMLGQDHLWEDMGFWSRKELTGLITAVFPVLAEKNTENMRWKKFIYKQLCIQEEFVYTCRSPSCAVCVDFKLCFAVEEFKDQQAGAPTKGA
ncbi:MAG: hypothetical protein A2600_11255 [Candidatus Lambdaproteobacteria bacterium RIFOXYD1_FULL_56_27]|uniref:Hydrogenase n=1 Tax=Candidatus Lambdaproteobacteria bacterium RIFOXYD2_FULL_56_26 TaxID=1817773 RepID=A0A1F6GZN5_9PROT|nr:MAG: hypothetical protein A2426_08470 [Candidatus Lambdaproteobacteria bacterium RIFOXYC1_FULL_56_13]OGH03549.1 MAG: hypothetical protein A2557_01190 [Candidatus Lambdaproteobacteria bacterium RIFOXYD2_FULL_56_26]OGH07665.1 MAG: hypothetical protein A2600_11255 [Candidatus Lambdaproteobacteria bacterium RIFOXYD1_FULL_56_27]